MGQYEGEKKRTKLSNLVYILSIIVAIVCFGVMLILERHAVNKCVLLLFSCSHQKI